ncbi:MAG: hypothetical protein Q9205_002975 [Flavoplaca limonia]
METGTQSRTKVEDKRQLEKMEEDADAEHDEEGDQSSPPLPSKLEIVHPVVREFVVLFKPITTFFCQYASQAVLMTELQAAFACPKALDDHADRSTSQHCRTEGLLLRLLLERRSRFGMTTASAPSNERLAGSIWCLTICQSGARSMSTLKTLVARFLSMKNRVGAGCRRLEKTPPFEFPGRAVSIFGGINLVKKLIIFQDLREGFKPREDRANLPFSANTDRANLPLSADTAQAMLPQAWDRQSSGIGAASDNVNLRSRSSFDPGHSKSRHREKGPVVNDGHDNALQEHGPAHNELPVATGDLADKKSNVG